MTTLEADERLKIVAMNKIENAAPTSDCERDLKRESQRNRKLRFSKAKTLRAGVKFSRPQSRFSV
jgi:hypothetical protein